MIFFVSVNLWSLYDQEPKSRLSHTVGALPLIINSSLGTSLANVHKMSCTETRYQG